LSVKTHPVDIAQPVIGGRVAEIMDLGFVLGGDYRGIGAVIIIDCFDDIPGVKGCAKQSRRGDRCVHRIGCCTVAGPVARSDAERITMPGLAHEPVIPQPGGFFQELPIAAVGAVFQAGVGDVRNAINCQPGQVQGGAFWSGGQRVHRHSRRVAVNAHVPDTVMCCVSSAVKGLGVDCNGFALIVGGGIQGGAPSVSAFVIGGELFPPAVQPIAGMRPKFHALDPAASVECLRCERVVPAAEVAVFYWMAHVDRWRGGIRVEGQGIDSGSGGVIPGADFEVILTIAGHLIAQQRVLDLEQDFIIVLCQFRCAVAIQQEQVSIQG